MKDFEQNELYQLENLKELRKISESLHDLVFNKLRKLSIFHIGLFVSNLSMVSVFVGLFLMASGVMAGTMPFVMNLGVVLVVFGMIFVITLLVYDRD